AVTASNPVDLIIPSGIAKHRITTVNTAGDFKNSGMCHVSNIQQTQRPHRQPKTTAKKQTAKNITNRIIAGSLAVKKVMIAKAKTASNAPIASTTIPSHFKILAGLGFNFD